MTRCRVVPCDPSEVQPDHMYGRSGRTSLAQQGPLRPEWSSEKLVLDWLGTKRGRHLLALTHAP